MRIYNIIPSTSLTSKINTSNNKRAADGNSIKDITKPERTEISKIPVVSFKAQHNIKQKTIDTEQETKKLLKQFDEILASDMSLEELIHLYERKITSQLIQKKQRAEVLYEEAEKLMQDPSISQMKAERLLAIQKEFKQLEKNVFKINPMQFPKKPDVNIDTALINKFKTAIIEDNFNLDKVYLDYYSGLNNIQTLEELNKTYPQIKFPDRPEYVIADRIVANLTRDFFEKLDRLIHKKDEQKVYDFLTQNVQEILQQSTKNSDDVFFFVF